MSNVLSRKFEWVDTTLTTVTGQTIPIRENILEFLYNESIFSPFICGNIVFQDSNKNLIASLPIQGGEKIKLKVRDPNEEEVEYNFVVWAITDRTTKNRIQVYNMKVISEEAIKNESVKIGNPLKGNVETIVNSILQELDSEKPRTIERSKFNISLIPGRVSPFSLLSRIAGKSVSEKANFSSSGSRAESTPGAIQVKGTAGYFFYENRNGYFFESIDKTCDSGSSYGGRPNRGDYYYSPNNEPNADNQGIKILSFSFDNEINIMKKLRLGGYSSTTCYYDFCTGEYKEQTWSLTDTFKNMAKLGTQEKLGKYQEEASKSPTRIMSMLLDHETWYNGEEPTTDGDNTEYPDYAAYFSAQAIGRQSILSAQKMYISVPGDCLLTIGEKINVYLPNTIPSEDRKNQPWDEENSGTYLISKVEHLYTCSNAQFVSKLELIRDSLGIPKGSSNVK